MQVETVSFAVERYMVFNMRPFRRIINQLVGPREAFVLF